VAQKGQHRRIEVPAPPERKHNNWAINIAATGKRGAFAGKRLWEYTEAIRGFRGKL